MLERIITASSNPGVIVLDPFCGCGTTVDAAQKLGATLVGIDVTTLAIDLIDARLRHTYGEAIRATYDILGIPRDMTGAEALFGRSPFEFERWCVMLLDGQPNEKQVGDKGIDGVIRFPLDAKGTSERVLVSVKGGATSPATSEDLVGTVESQHAGMGIFICMRPPTAGMIDAANHSGTYRHPANGQIFPRSRSSASSNSSPVNDPRCPWRFCPTSRPANALTSTSPTPSSDGHQGSLRALRTLQQAQHVLRNTAGLADDQEGQLLADSRPERPTVSSG